MPGRSLAARLLSGGPRREGLRSALGARTLDLGARLRRLHAIVLEVPPSAVPGPRYGHGRPDHQGLSAILARHEAAYRDTLEAIVARAPALLELPPRPTDDPLEPHWLNPWQPGLDAAAIYALVRDRRPTRYVEVGSGISTMFAARAIRDGGLDTRVVSIDPQPRLGIDALCDEVIRAPLETLEAFPEVGPDDILFVDDSHRVFTGSDVSVFFLDWLPALPGGALVGLHDILLPSDYFPEWSGYHWSEQYLLAAWLLGGGARMRPLLASAYASSQPELAAIVEPLFGDPRLAGVDPRGFAFWFEVDQDGAAA